MSEIAIRIFFVLILVLILVSVLFSFSFYPLFHMSDVPIQAIAVFQHPKIKGTVRFTENLNEKNILVEVHIEGVKKGLHGFHIHRYGDMSQECLSMCEHFNPTNKKHGGRTSKERHAGDLGNVEADKNGVVHVSFVDSVLRLRGKNSILGRGVILHEDEDDLGLGGHELSLTTGNSGKRIACAVVGYAQPL